MKFEIGKFYKTRDGRKAQIFMLDNGKELMLGAVLIDCNWLARVWKNNGSSTLEFDRDLVSEWRDPIKYSMELWGNEWHPNDFDKTGACAAKIFGIGRKCNGTKLPVCPIKYRITVEEVPE